MYNFEKNQKAKFAKIRCYQCKKVVFGLIDEFIGEFGAAYNPVEEMYWINENEHIIKPSIKYDGICPNCGKSIHLENDNIKYLILDFNKF